MGSVSNAREKLTVVTMRDIQNDVRNQHDGIVVSLRISGNNSNNFELGKNVIQKKFELLNVGKGVYLSLLDRALLFVNAAENLRYVSVKGDNFRCI